MNNFVLGIFVDEIIRQCEFALISWEYLQASLIDEVSDWLEEDYNRVFCYIQSFLVATANISKILFPKPKFRIRGEELRRILQVPKNSPIKDKYFRNVFEHYDNEIERWASSSKKKNYSDVNISIGMFSAEPVLDPIDNMRKLDISRDRKNLTLTFHGKSYNLTMTEPVIRKLLERAKKLRPSLF